jgi:hypothetical protein
MGRSVLRPYTLGGASDLRNSRKAVRVAPLWGWPEGWRRAQMGESRTYCGTGLFLFTYS